MARSDDVPRATWHPEKLPIGINRRLASNDRTADLPQEMIAIGRLAGDSHHRTADLRQEMIAIGRLAGDSHHRTADLHRDRDARDQTIAIVHPVRSESDGG